MNIGTQMIILARDKKRGLLISAMLLLFLVPSFSLTAHGGRVSTPAVSAIPLMGGAVQKTLSLAGSVSTFLGKSPSPFTNDGTGAAAGFNSPYGLTTDGTNLYVADTFHNTIRKVVIATGVVTTFTDGGKAADFNLPYGIATDGTNLYVADSGNSIIRKVVIATGVVTTFSGGVRTPGFADGTGAAARFYSPSGVTTDGKNLYVADYNHTVRKVVIATGVVTTLAGSAGVSGSTNGTGAAAKFNGPHGITTDGTNLYVVDLSHTIRKVVIATGAVTTFAGGAQGFADGTGAAAGFNTPQGITTDGANLYVADTANSTIRKVVITTGVATTLAGKPFTTGSTDGVGMAARFDFPQGITTDGTNLYVADSTNNTIRKVVIATGAVTTLAGTAGWVSPDGTGTAGEFDNPQGITTDGANLYVADAGHNTIRKAVIATGVITTLAGKYEGRAEGTGMAARFYNPSGLTTDGTNVYVADTANDSIRKVVIATGVVTTLAGSLGVNGSTDGTGMAARFNHPVDITTDGTNLYVADTFNNTIRKVVLATGVVTTLAGSAGVEGSTDGTGPAARFDGPFSLTTDGTNLYVADTRNSTIRKVVLATGVVTTLAGTAGVEGSTDGTGAAARFDGPFGVTTDGTNLYVADTFSNTIRKVVIATGVVTTLAGSAGVEGSTDGTNTAARFNYPHGITTDGANLYVVDSTNDTIRKIR